MVNKRNGRPSRTVEGRAASYRSHKAIFTTDTTTREKFHMWMTSLYVKYNTYVPSKEVNTLKTLRDNGRSNRFQTDPSEWACVESKLKGTVKPRLIYDVGSGYKNLANCCAEKYPESQIATMDIDAAVEPDIVADFLNPATYGMRRRPELVATRYVCNYTFITWFWLWNCNPIEKTYDMSIN